MHEPPLDLQSISDERYDQLGRRLVAAQTLRALQQRSRKDVESAAQKLGVHPTTVYRDLKRLEGRGTVRDLVPRPTGFPKGRSRLHPRQEELIQAFLSTEYLTRASPSLVAVTAKIGNVCEDEGLSRPGRTAIARRLKAFPKRTIVLKRKGPKPPHCWAVCRACLQEDQIQGRAPYVRRVWTHPLSVFCRAHNAPLSPHGNSDIKIASDLALFGDGAEPIEPRDSLLDTAQFDDPEMLVRVFRVLDDSGGADALERRLRLRWAVRDVIDALRTNVRTPNSGVLSSLLESPPFQRRSPAGSNHMPQDCWADLEAATRLLYVRLALLVLAEPGDPVLSDKISPLGRNWLLFRYRHTKIKGWQALFEHVAQDLMFLLPMELPRNAILQLDERFLAWPRDLRRRWTYAPAAGAIGGYVY